jgi:tetratricopeptide (TPR) repeat protein
MDVRSHDSALTWLSEGLPQMIAGKLAHVGAVDVVPPAQLRAVLERSGRAGGEPIDDATARDIARRVGATLAARGAVARDGEKLVLELHLNDVAKGTLTRDAVLTGGDALALADEAAARILGATNVRESGPQLAEFETTSVEAYQHYMRALEAGRAGRLTDVARELDAAIALDSGFVTALRERLSSLRNSPDTVLQRRLRETIQRHLHRATEFDRMDIEVTDAFYAGGRERSEALGRAFVRRYPRDPRAYQLLQTILGSHGAFEEAERIAVQVLALDSLALEAGNGPCAPCQGLHGIVNFHWVQADFRGAADWARRWIRTQPDGPAAWAALAWTYSYMQRPDSALPLMQRAVSLSGGDLWASEELARMLLVAREYDAADTAIRAMEESPAAARRELAFDLRQLLQRERGAFRAANRTIDRLAAASPGSAGFADIMRAANEYSLGEHAKAARRFEAPAHVQNPAPYQFPLPAATARAFCWHHALAADAYAPSGDTVWLRAVADTLAAACTRSFYGRDWKLHHHVRGLVAMRGGRWAEAERELELATWAPMEGWSRTTVALAAAQAAQGRHRDAIATLRTAYATRLNAMGRYVPISELDWRMAQLFTSAGERDSARVYAGYARRAWRDADPEVRRLLGDGLPGEPVAEARPTTASRGAR